MSTKTNVPDGNFKDVLHVLYRQLELSIASNIVLMVKFPKRP